PKAVFQTPSREDRTIAHSPLPLKIKLRGPAPGHAVLKFHVGCDVGVLPRSRNSRSGIGLDLQVSRFFEVMVVGDKVRALLGMTQSKAGAYHQKQHPALFHIIHNCNSVADKLNTMLD